MKKSIIYLPLDEAGTESAVWEDVLLESAQDLELTVQDLPPSLRAEVLATSYFPEAMGRNGVILLHMPLRQAWDLPSSYISFLIFPHKLLLLHREECSYLTQLRQRVESRKAAGVYDVASLLSYILDVIIEHNIQAFSEAKRRVEEVGDILLADPEQIDQKEILNLRRLVSKLVSQFEDQFYSLSSLYSLPEASIIFPQLNIRDLTDVQSHLVNSVSRLDVRLRDLQQYHQYVLQGHTEKRLRYLTILTSIFMPLTLLTGLYGMNFKYMPELDYEYSYFILLSAMAVLVAVLVIIFRKNGWFK